MIGSLWGVAAAWRPSAPKMRRIPYKGAPSSRIVSVPMRIQCLLFGFCLFASPLVHAGQADCILHGNSPGSAGILDSTGAGCTDEDRVWLKANQAKIDALKQQMHAPTPEQVKERQAALLKQELADADRQFRANMQQTVEEAQRREAADLRDRQTEYQRDIDAEVNRITRYDSENARQSAQQPIADRQTQQIAARRPAPAAPLRPDPLAPAPPPAQSLESRRAAGLPDDPAAAACIQDDDCARALLHGGSTTATH